MGHYIPNSTENGIQTGVQMNAQNISAMRDLQNTKAQAEMQNRALLMQRANKLQDDLLSGPDPEVSKNWSAEKKDLWKKQTEEELNRTQSGLGMFIDANGQKHYQSNPYALGRVDSAYASRTVDQNIIDQAFNKVEDKDANGKVIGYHYEFSNPDTAKYAKDELGITPDMSYDDIRSRIQGKQNNLRDIMGDSYMTDPVTQHYGAYNSPQHNDAKRWAMQDPGLGIAYASAPEALGDNTPYMVPGSELPFDQDAFTKIDMPVMPTPPIKHGTGYDTSKIPSNSADRQPRATLSNYTNPYTDYLDKIMIRNSPRTDVPYRPAPTMPAMEQSPLPGVSQYQNAYSAVLPRINYNIPYKYGGGQ